VRRHSLVLAALIILGATGETQAQQEQSTLPCDAFQKTPDGMWRATKSAEITTQTPTGRIIAAVGRGATFGPGVKSGGLDLYSLLEQQCH
jgi:hypothetical protein